MCVCECFNKNFSFFFYLKLKSLTGRVCGEDLRNFLKSAAQNRPGACVCFDSFTSGIRYLACVFDWSINFSSKNSDDFHFFCDEIWPTAQLFSLFLVVFKRKLIDESNQFVLLSAYFFGIFSRFFQTFLKLNLWKTIEWLSKQTTELAFWSIT